MANEFTNDQIADLRALEKVRVRRGGQGFCPEMQELIDRLKAGGVGPLDITDSFLVQSKALWDKGWGRELGFRRIDAYRKSLEADGLVVKPERPDGMPNYLDRLVLWDQRPLLREEGMKPRVSLVKVCRLLGVFFSGDDDTFMNCDSAPEITEPVRWVWCQDGRRNRGKAPRDCRIYFTPPEVGLEAIGGLFLYAQDHAVIGGEEGAWHFMDLAGSVPRDPQSHCAYLELWHGRPRLGWHRHFFANPESGSASRWGVRA